ncbi:MAG: aminopeptidase [Firmicutes bacterium]|nr:aminopeptidase [Bacillota bacterium]
MERENCFKFYDEAARAELESVAADYRRFLSVGKTERECVKEIVRQAEAAGYRNMAELAAEGVQLQAGDKVYAVCMKKAVALFRIGKLGPAAGMQILGAHIDSPRLDIKQNPLFEDGELAFLDTHYYGGIKKYQWVAIPLALHGTVVKKDGTAVDIVIGEDADDPVFCVTDLLIHLAQNQLEKKGARVVEGEDLNILIGNSPLVSADKEETKKNPVLANMLHILQQKYGLEEEDLLSAELEAVPAGPAREAGLDASMILGYGQDDRSCAYTSLRAMLEVEDAERTACCLLMDKEEIGSVGATGMESRFFENTVAELLALCGEYSELTLRRALANSRMLSSDVSSAYDPAYAAAFEKKNIAYLSHGLVFNKFTGARGKSGSNDANAEYLAYLRRVMDEAGVHFQTAELGRVDLGGGGTIAYILALYGMEVIDSGVPVLSMHAPWEVTSKADIYEAYRGYKAFLRA